MRGDQGQTFGLDPELIYLNHAAVAPWPLCTTEAVMRFAQENAFRGAERYPEWLKKEQQLRQQLQQLINAPAASDIALLKNTSEALSVVAYGLTWQPGDNIVISDQEFPSNRVVWESLQSQGVEVTQVNLCHPSQSAEELLIAATCERTRLLAISSIQYATGFALDLKTLGEHCHRYDILFCVDAIQSIGAVAIDVQAINADFVMADGHKWMLGPEGLAVFYCKASLREQLTLHQFGWHMLEHANDFDSKRWEVAKSARRFECGSPNMLAIHALSASVELLLETGMASIGQRVIQNSAYLMDALKTIKGIELITANETGRYGGIVTFRPVESDLLALFETLKRQRVICAMRGGGIRFSPHYYTSLAQLDNALNFVAASVNA